MDFPPLTPAQADLAAAYFPLARARAAAHRAAHGGDPDALLDDALLALMRATTTHDPNGRAGFGTWARLKIDWALLDLHRAEARRCARLRPLGGVAAVVPPAHEGAALRETIRAADPELVGLIEAGHQRRHISRLTRSSVRQLAARFERLRHHLREAI